MSVVGTNRKCHRRLATSAFGGLTDIRYLPERASQTLIRQRKAVVFDLDRNIALPDHVGTVFAQENRAGIEKPERLRYQSPAQFECADQNVG